MALTRTNWPDVDDVVALNADTEVMRYLDHGRPMTPARVLAEESLRALGPSRCHKLVIGRPSSALTRVSLCAHLEHVEIQLHRGAYAPKRADV
jgi:hypothetical protein